MDELYQWYEEVGLVYGPKFRALQQIVRRDGEALAEVKLPEALGEDGSFLVHPVLLDACFQASAAALESDGLDEAWLPLGVERLELLDRPGAEVQVRVRARRPSNEAQPASAVTAVMLDAVRVHTT